MGAGLHNQVNRRGDKKFHGWIKGDVLPDFICLEVVWLNSPRLEDVMLDFIQNFTRLLWTSYATHNKCLLILCFCGKKLVLTLVGLQFSLARLKKVLGVTLDVIVRWPVQLSSHQHWWIFPVTIGQWKVRPYPLPNYNYNYLWKWERATHSTNSKLLQRRMPVAILWTWFYLSESFLKQQVELEDSQCQQ